MVGWCPNFSMAAAKAPTQALISHYIVNCLPSMHNGRAKQHGVSSNMCHPIVSLLMDDSVMCSTEHSSQAWSLMVAVPILVTSDDIFDKLFSLLLREPYVWNAHLSGPGAIESRPLGHYFEGIQKQEVLSKQKYNEISLQQARRFAVVQAKAMGATGNFKSFDSHFGNYLVPVIPTNIVSKSQISPSEGGGELPSPWTPSN
eukprot:Gb_36301 [translate_table: standard]